VKDSLTLFQNFHSSPLTERISDSYLVNLHTSQYTYIAVKFVNFLCIVLLIFSQFLVSPL